MPHSSSPDRGERRLLRVGIVHGRRIVEERLLARAGDVTIGTSPRSTFIVPWDDAPLRWRLFEERGGRRFLHLAGGMSARIADGATVTSIDARGAGEPARPIPLSDRARGKVTVGDTTVLFQLLRPPAPQPRPQLPISVRRRLTDGIDPLLQRRRRVHVAAARRDRRLPAAGRLAAAAVDRGDPRSVHPPDHPHAAPDPAARRAARDRRAHAEGCAPPARAGAARRAVPAHAAEVTGRRSKPRSRRLGLIPLLTARAPDGSSAITDVLSGGAVDRSLDDALRGVRDIAIAGTDSLHGIHGPGTGHGKIGIPSDLRPGPGIDAARATGPVVERDVSSRLKVDRPVIEGGRADLESITREIRARRKAIAACYERALKARPTLAGKLVVRFTITAAGTISTVDIDDDTLGAPEVGACVRAIVQRWRFAPPTEAPVELSFPFVFQAGS